MKLAVLSDTHDSIRNLRQIMPHLREADAVLHCGDLVTPSFVQRLVERVSSPLHIVWGNCDRERVSMQQIAEGWEHISLHGVTAHLELEAQLPRPRRAPGRDPRQRAELSGQARRGDPARRGGRPQRPRSRGTSGSDRVSGPAQHRMLGFGGRPATSFVTSVVTIRGRTADTVAMVGG